MPATDAADATRVIAVKWIKNNILSAIIYAVISLLLDGLGYAVRDATSEIGLVLSWIYFLIGIASWTFAGIAEGVLTGAVLQRIVPFLPVRNWIALHAGIAAILFVFFRALGPARSGGAVDVDQATIGLGLVVAVILGAIVGALIGGLQALVLRGVALGTGSWIRWAAAAYAVGMVIWTCSDTLLDLDTGLAGMLARQVIEFVAAVIGAVIMLPALSQLKSRTLTLAGQHFT